MSKKLLIALLPTCFLLVISLSVILGSIKKIPHSNQQNGTAIHDNPTITATPTQVITLVPTIDYGPIDIDIAHWQTYTLKDLKMTFKLPPQISKYVGKDLKIDIYTPNHGTYTGINYIAYAAYSKRMLVSIGADSVDASAGRDAILTDLIGYSVNNGNYTTKYGSSGRYTTVNIPQENIDGEIVNNYGVHMLKVKHTHTQEMSHPFFFFNGDGITTLINTPNQTYPGVVLDIYLPKDTNDIVLNKILSTVSFE